MSSNLNPHAGPAVESYGAAPEHAPLVVVTVHGRTLDAGYMKTNVCQRLERDDLSFVLPNAGGNTWYPHSFLLPREENEPELGLSLEHLESIRRGLEDRGVPDSSIAWLGFSQGACLVADYVARSPRRFAALVCFTGGLIGPDDQTLARPVAVEGMPAFACVSDIDPFVPLERVERTVELFSQAGAVVDFAVYPGAAHEVTDGAIERGASLLRRLEDLSTRAIEG